VKDVTLSDYVPAGLR